MCGICGFYSLENSSVQENTKILNSMTESLHHRGPDAIGSYKKENIYLGHTRLSIIDLDDRVINLL